jgi:hypothetical protein
MRYFLGVWRDDGGDQNANYGAIRWYVYDEDGESAPPAPEYGFRSSHTIHSRYTPECLCGALNRLGINRITFASGADASSGQFGIDGRFSGDYTTLTDLFESVACNFTGYDFFFETAAGTDGSGGLHYIYRQGHQESAFPTPRIRQIGIDFYAIKSQSRRDEDEAFRALCRMVWLENGGERRDEPIKAALETYRTAKHRAREAEFVYELCMFSEGGRLSLAGRLTSDAELERLCDAFKDGIAPVDGITALDLGGNRALTRLPPSIAVFTALQELNLEGTAVADTPPALAAHIAAGKAWSARRRLDLIQEIRNTVHEMDEYAIDGKAVYEMSDEEWLQNVGIYKEKYSYLLYGDESDKEFRNFLLFKICHEDAEGLESMLNIACEELETRFQQTVNLVIGEDGRTVVDVVDADEGGHVYHYDNRIVPL